MAGLKNKALLLLFLGLSTLKAFSFEYLNFTVDKRTEVSLLIDRFYLSGTDIDSFLKKNDLKHHQFIDKGKELLLPIRVYPFTKKTIRASIGINNYAQAVSIKNYNDLLHKEGLKDASSKTIWVPISFLHDHRSMNDKGHSPFKPYHVEYELFGSEYQKFTVKDEKLKGKVFYLVSGHGGPDPGANCNKDGHFLCEDEYAYDIVLRLSRNLMIHGAKVYIIVQDKNDGIRDETYLNLDHDEVVYGDMEIPLNQVQRLKQRTDIINELYRLNEDKYEQRLIELHIDSRSEDKKIDLFFYHFPGSEEGRILSEKLLSTIKRKYAQHQSSRGYDGVVKERDLFSLRETLPKSVYIEIGNITNSFDQKRILIPNNRQAIANWLTEGLM
ncbi:MAG: N-acetylmuramoyl-L-alanine amidase [Flavobacteriales bacterium]|nr:N-acetylmuramoyl-L-alanine amidase [Flavobacteriales bacterium]